MIRQEIKNLLKRVTIDNKEEIDNKIKEIQVDVMMRPIKKDIERYGIVNGRKLA